MVHLIGGLVGSLATAATELVEELARVVDTHFRAGDLDGHIAALILVTSVASDRSAVLRQRALELATGPLDPPPSLSRSRDVAQYGARLFLGRTQRTVEAFETAARRELRRVPCPPAACLRDDDRLLLGIAAGIGSAAPTLGETLLDILAQRETDASLCRQAMDAFARSLVNDTSTFVLAARGALPRLRAIARDGSVATEGERIAAFWLAARLGGVLHELLAEDQEAVATISAHGGTAFTARPFQVNRLPVIEAAMLLDALSAPRFSIDPAFGTPRALPLPLSGDGVAPYKASTRDTQHLAGRPVPGSPIEAYGTRTLGVVDAAPVKFVVACSRAELLAAERGIAEMRDAGTVANSIRTLAAAVSEPTVSARLRDLATTLGYVPGADERRMSATSHAIASVCRDLHRRASFTPGTVIEDAAFVAFLRAALREDTKLGLGVTLSLLAVLRRLRVPAEQVDAAAARALEEELAYVSDVDGQPYALQLNQEDVESAIVELERSMTQTSDPATRPSLALTIDIGILTIKDEEFDAVLAEFPVGSEVYVGPTTHRHYNLRTTPAGNGAFYRVAITRQPEQGNGEAQAAARDLLEDLSPTLILVVGIAGGLPTKDFTLGDVILSLRINDYSVEAVQDGRETTYAMGGGAIERRIENHVANLRARLNDLGNWTERLPDHPPVVLDDANFYGPDTWKASVRESLTHHFQTNLGDHPRFRSGVIASSDRLIKDTAILIPWLQTQRNLLAVEMESGGVYRATRGRCAMLAVRGLSDIVGFRRDEQWTRYACASAAAFARAYLRTTPVPTTPPPMPSSRGPSISSPPAEVGVATGEFLPTHASLSTKNRGAAPSVAWQLRASPLLPIDATKSELHTALQESMVVQQVPRDFQRTARWPRLLRLPEASISSLPDGTRLWRHTYSAGGNKAGEEQLAFLSNGELVFQRDTLWDVDDLGVEIDQLSFDTMVLIALVSRLTTRLGFSGEIALKLRLRTSQATPGPLALFSGSTVMPEQPDRSARLQRSPVFGEIRVPAGLLAEDQLAQASKRLLDRILNEFELEPSFHRSVGPPFLAIDGESLERLARTLQG